MFNKISDNKTIKDLRDQIQALEIIASIASNLTKAGVLDKDILLEITKLPELKNSLKELTSVLDKFNSYFSTKGWIAYESMNFEVMKNAVLIAEKGNLNLAEEELVKYYKPNLVEWTIGTLNGIIEFRPRLNLLYKACQDYKEKRFYACVPIVLMMIDGFVNDIEQKGFFAEGTELTVWDTIAAHHSGLAILSKIFGQARTRTNTDEITMPYRNGILHGRDLSYDTEIVAAKTWALLFCVANWARSFKQGKKIGEPDIKVAQNNKLEDFVEALKGYSEYQQKSKYNEKLIAEWKPRNLIIGKDIPENGLSIDYGNKTPEKEIVQFIEHWQKCNYGKIAQQIWDYHKIPETFKKRAGRLRENLSDIKPASFSILEIIDEAPAISEVIVKFLIRKKDSEFIKEKKLRLIYMDDNRTPLCRSENGGSWKIVENFFDLNIDN